jgi:hypothetical protein
MDKEQWLLTTEDNPYSPFDDWDSWYGYDTRMGYNTCALLARVAVTGSTINDGGTKEAMEMIVKHDVTGKHMMVTRKIFAALHTKEQ